MAVYPPDAPAPPPPPAVGLGITQHLDTDKDTIEQAQPTTQDEKDEKKRRWPRCLHWMLKRVVAQKERPTTKRSIMGRFGDLFKKSDGKSKAENPYAQPPVDQSSPLPQYGQYNQSQYNDNRYTTQQTQGLPSGLPAGPRPGGLPSRVAPGPSRTDTWESNRTAGTAPPQYSEQTSPPPPSYHGSPSTFSGGKSPAFSSNTASPSLGGASPALSSNRASPSVGGGFPREKYGAQDGFGSNRFEPSNTSPYDRSAAFPSQRQGGYGGLDTESGGLFANYQPPNQRTPGPSQVQSGSSSDAPGEYGDRQMMTEEDEVDWTKRQIVEEKVATNDTARRNLGMLTEANDRMDAMNAQLRREWEILKNTEKNLDNSHGQAKVSGVNIDDLDAANTTMFNLAANSKSRIAQRAERKLNIRREHQLKQDEIQQEAGYVDREWDLERQKLQAAKPKGLLGNSSQKTDASKFQFEDDTGEQQALDDEYDQLVEGMERQTGRLLEQAQFQNFMVNKQNQLLTNLTDKADTVNDRVQRNQMRLDVRYNKR